MYKGIYLKNLPQFSSYELIDLFEKMEMLEMQVYGDDSFSVEELYIKGINKIDDKENDNDKDNDKEKEKCRVIEDYEVFLNDYLELGEKIFNISHNVFLDKPVVCEDSSELINKYIGEEYNNIDLLDEKYKEQLKPFWILYSKIDYYVKDDENDSLTFEQEKYLTDLIDILDNIIALFSFINEEIEYDISNEINTLISSFENYYNYFLKEEKDSKNLLKYQFKDLDLLINKINLIIEENNLNIKKKLALSYIKSKVGYKMTNINFKNYFNDNPIHIYLNYTEYKEVKKLILEWVKKYGIPYNVSESDIELYKKKLSEKNLNFSENDLIVPCKHLIYNSVFNYLIYTILDKQCEADEKIKKLFDVNTTKSFTRKDMKEIYNIQKAYKYYLNNIGNEILGFKIPMENPDVEHDHANEEKVNKQNHFYHIYKDEMRNKQGKKINFYAEKHFYNLCIVANELVKEQTIFIGILHKKYCLVCKKWFDEEDFKFTKYCSDKCQKEGNQIKNTKNKRKNKNKKIIEMNKIETPRDIIKAIFGEEEIKENKDK